jgi:hypothetical protein
MLRNQPKVHHRCERLGNHAERDDAREEEESGMPIHVVMVDENALLKGTD